MSIGNPFDNDSGMKSKGIVSEETFLDASQGFDQASNQVHQPTKSAYDISKARPNYHDE